jgi:hypothetical protein
MIIYYSGQDNKFYEAVIKTARLPHVGKGQEVKPSPGMLLDLEHSSKGALDLVQVAGDGDPRVIVRVY